MPLNISLCDLYILVVLSFSRALVVDNGRKEGSRKIEVGSNVVGKEMNAKRRI